MHSAGQRYRISLVIHDFKPTSSAVPLHPQWTAAAARDPLYAALRTTQIHTDALPIEKCMNNIQTAPAIRQSGDAVVFAGLRQRSSKVRGKGDAAGIISLANSNQVADNVRRHHRPPSVALTAECAARAPDFTA